MSHKGLAGAIQSKFWGQTQCIFVGPSSETHFLKIKKNGYCSEHCHKKKWNRFFLISGKLKVIIYRPNGQDETILEAGQFTDVPPGDYHKFECLEDCQCLEIYWVDDLDVTDIERRTTGGIKEKKSRVDLDIEKEIKKMQSEFERKPHIGPCPHFPADGFDPLQHEQSK